MISVRSLFAISGFAAVLASVAGSAMAAEAICYNCPPKWADWAAQIEAVKKATGVAMPFDNKNSGQSLSQLITEKAKPVADIAYFGVTFGIKAKAAGVTEGYKPKGFDEIPDGLKDPEGHWFTTHFGTLGLFVNKAALGKAPTPKCWKDLLKPEYKGMVGYLDPSSAFVGYAGAVAVNRALGGSLDSFDAAISFFKDLKQNQPIVPKQTSYARVVSGEIPILFDYDFNAYRAKYTEKGSFEFVIPCEGTVVVPYVQSLVKGAPHMEDAKKVLDFIMSDAGQTIWTNAFLKPARPVKLPADVAAKFLPDSDYARAKPLDYAKMEQVQKGFSERYLTEVR